MTAELNKLRSDLIFGGFEWTIRYRKAPDEPSGFMSLLVKKKLEHKDKEPINIGCPSECNIVDILKQASPKISAEAVGTVMDIYGYRLLWEGDVIQSLEYNLSEGKFTSIVLAPKAISNFE